MTRLLNRILEPTKYDREIAKLFYFHFRATAIPRTPYSATSRRPPALR
jgi:hypothetical protein